MPNLFTPFTLKDVTLRNRVAVPPMCQYSAEDGVPNDWHLAHYSQLARGGAGLVIVEATAVAPEGRITPNCLGIWNDEQLAEHKKIAAAIKKAGSVPGLQIAHAGIKASANRPWDGDDHLPADDPRAWETIGPSAVSFGTDALNRVARAMTINDIQRVQNDFVAAAKRALEAGYEWLELHCAHGYLSQSFYSRHTNQRDDEYGGSVENRGRFALETLQATREVWPENLPLTMRFGVLEFDGHDEETLGESIALVKKLKQSGLDFLSVSMGFSTPKANIPWGPAFLAPYAERVRKESLIPVGSAWGFDTPSVADASVRNEVLDIVFVGRAHLSNPHWSYQAALDLGIKEPEHFLPDPYKFWLERYHMRRA
jgi:2,4-dienoyl-CoA reductase-like NADH-dependent reductase (Old Yellow Enzyme family)